MDDKEHQDGRDPCGSGSRASTEPVPVSALSGFDPSCGALLAYGHAAYCAGWSAACRCLSSPADFPDWHSRDWIENNPPEQFNKPLIWLDGKPAITRPRDSDGPRMAETASQARGEAGPARADEGGIAQTDSPNASL
jgi:hypothetical protein